MRTCAGERSDRAEQVQLLGAWVAQLSWVHLDPIRTCVRRRLLRGWQPWTAREAPMRFWQRRAFPASPGPPQPVVAVAGQQRSVQPLAEPDATLYKVDCLVCGDDLGVVSSLRAAELLLLHTFGMRGVGGHDPSARCYLREGQDFLMLPVPGPDAPTEPAPGLTG